MNLLTLLFSFFGAAFEFKAILEISQGVERNKMVLFKESFSQVKKWKKKKMVVWEMHGSVFVYDFFFWLI